MWKADRRRLRFGAASVFAMTAVLVATSMVVGADTTGKSSERKLEEAGEGIFEVLEAAEQYAEARTAPSGVVDASAFSGAYLEAKNLPVVGGPWTEATPNRYDSDARGYRRRTAGRFRCGAAAILTSDIALRAPS